MSVTPSRASRSLAFNTPSSLVRNFAGRAISIASGGLKRKLSEKFTKNKKRKNVPPPRKGGPINEGRGGTYARVGRTKGKGTKKTRRQKISKQFKKKVEQVLESKMPQGIVVKSGLTSIQQATVNNRQMMNEIFNGNYHVFAPEQFVDAASILWNGKANAEITAIGDANNLYPKTVRINVLDSKVVVNMRNNGQRTLHIELLEIRSKDPDNTATPFATWLAAINSDLATGTLVGLLDNSYDLIGNKPQMTSTYSKYYSDTCTKIVMEPGQTHVWNIQGPNNTVIDMAKFHDPNGGLYIENNKLKRWLYVRMHTDLIADANNNVGHWKQNAGGHGLLLETSLHYRLECPREVVVANVKRAAAYKSYHPAMTEAAQRIDENDCGVDMAPPK